MNIKARYYDRFLELEENEVTILQFINVNDNIIAVCCRPNGRIFRTGIENLTIL